MKNTVEEGCSKALRLTLRVLKGVLDAVVTLEVSVLSGLGVLYVKYYVLESPFFHALLYALVVSAAVGMWMGSKISKEYRDNEES